MTGRAAGYCAGYGEPGFTSAPAFTSAPGFGGGFSGRGRRSGRGFGPDYGAGYGAAAGRGRGFGPGPWFGGYAPGGAWGEPPASAENRKQQLNAELEAMEERAAYLRREIDALSNEEGTDS
jgi:hypothetical protein